MEKRTNKNNTPPTNREEWKKKPPLLIQYPFLKRVIASFQGRLKSTGTPQKEFSDMAGVSPSRLSLIMNFKTLNPRMETLNKIDSTLQELEKNNI